MFSLKQLIFPKLFTVYKSYTELEITGFLHRKVTKYILGQNSADNNDAS